MRSFKISVMTATVLVACLPTVAPAQDPQRVPGIVQLSDSEGEPVISAPEQVRVGEEFQVTVTTFGGGCEEAGDTNVLTTEKSATIFVYDLTVATRPGVACTAILKRFPHTATLKFTKPGEAVIRVWGRQTGRYTAPGGTPVVLEYRLTVTS